MENPGGDFKELESSIRYRRHCFTLYKEDFDSICLFYLFSIYSQDYTKSRVCLSNV